VSLSEWLQLVQTVCLIGAFVGLIIQLRFTAKIAKAAAYQNLVSQIELLHDRLYSSEDAQALKDALAPNVDVSPRQMVLALSLLNLLESAHFQHVLGVIPSGLWAGWRDQISSYFKMPFFRKVWRANRQAYNSDFRSLVDEADGRASFTSQE
jgi:hypothetical protein